MDSLSTRRAEVQDAADVQNLFDSHAQRWQRDLGVFASVISHMCVLVLFVASFSSHSCSEKTHYSVVASSGAGHAVGFASFAAIPNHPAIDGGHWEEDFVKAFPKAAVQVIRLVLLLSSQGLISSRSCMTPYG